MTESSRPSPGMTRCGWIVAILFGLAVASQVSAEIAYTALEGGVWRVYRQADLGATPQSVRPSLGFDASAPALSPDGSRVAFEVPGHGIRVCPLVPGGNCRSIEAEPGSAVRPAWDPRSEELVFARYVADAGGEDSDLVITRRGLEASGPLVLQTGNQDAPDFSPDGRWLVYSSAQTVALRQAGVAVVRHLWLMDLATGEARPLVPGSSQDMNPDWSPDGSRVAFASDRGGRLEIWTVKPDGSDLQQVTGGPGSKSWPAWSPDGKSLLFTRSHQGRSELWLVSADGSGARQFAPFGADSDVQLRDADWR